MHDEIIFKSLSSNIIQAQQFLIRYSFLGSDGFIIQNTKRNNARTLVTSC